MRRGSVVGWIGALCLITTVLGCQAARPTAPPSPLCFAATGHAVWKGFADAFRHMGGETALGYPITEAFEQEGRQVQYFEYARLEDHPDNPGGPTFKLSMLGERLDRRRPPLPADRIPSTLDTEGRYYAPFGHAVRGDFLTFFDGKGGLDRFGFPIAEPLVADGELVQDFQRSRFVWHARGGPNGRVTLEAIGRVYFEWQGLDPALLAPAPCPDGVPAE
jgi:hypothetical protein